MLRVRQNIETSSLDDLPSQKAVELIRALDVASQTEAHSRCRSIFLRVRDVVVLEDLTIGPKKGTHVTFVIQLPMKYNLARQKLLGHTICSQDGTIPHSDELDQGLDDSIRKV